MPEVTGKEFQLDRFISADPGNGVLAALDSTGAAVNLIAYGTATGDVTYSAPTGSGGNTRRHLYDRPIVSTSSIEGTTGAFSSNLTVGGTAAVTGAITSDSTITLNNGQHYRAKRNTGGVALNLLGYVAGTDNLETVLSDSWLIKDTAGTTKISLRSDGSAAFGTTTFGNAGDITLGATNALRAVIGGGARNMIGVDANSVIQLGDSGNYVVAMPRFTGVAAAASLKGAFYADTATAGRLVFFDGVTGARYRLDGVAF